MTTAEKAPSRSKRLSRNDRELFDQEHARRINAERAVFSRVAFLEAETGPAAEARRQEKKAELEQKVARYLETKGEEQTVFVHGDVKNEGHYAFAVDIKVTPWVSYAQTGSRSGAENIIEFRLVEEPTVIGSQKAEIDRVYFQTRRPGNDSSHKPLYYVGITKGLFFANSDGEIDLDGQLDMLQRGTEQLRDAIVESGRISAAATVIKPIGTTLTPPVLV